jgi:hypothetical protein
MSAAALALPSANSRVCIDCSATLDQPHARYCTRCRPAHRKRKILYISTAQIDAEITAAYRKFREFNNRAAITLAARRIGWPRHAVLKRARALGLARTKEAPWSEAELQVLEQFGYLSDAKLSEKLRARGFTRSATAVHLKVKRLRIKSNGDWYSATTGKGRKVLVSRPHHRRQNMSVSWVLAIAFVLVIAFAFRMLFHALRVEGLLRNLMDAVEVQGRDDKDLERLHAAMEDARRFFRP